jgi:hypothetical protein
MMCTTASVCRALLRMAQRTNVPLPLIRSLHVRNAVPSGLDITKMEQLCAIQFEDVDMRSVQHLPSVMHLEIYHCRNLNDTLSDLFGVRTACSPCGTGGVWPTRECEQ